MLCKYGQEEGGEREGHVFVRMRVSNSRWQDIKGNSKVTIVASSKNYYMKVQKFRDERKDCQERERTCQDAQENVKMKKKGPVLI
jgi:hypothetical protein